MTDLISIYCIFTQETIKVSLVSNLTRNDLFVKYFFTIFKPPFVLSIAD